MSGKGCQGSYRLKAYIQNSRNSENIKLKWEAWALAVK